MQECCKQISCIKQDEKKKSQVILNKDKRSTQQPQTFQSTQPSLLSSSTIKSTDDTDSAWQKQVEMKRQRKFSRKVLTLSANTLGKVRIQSPTLPTHCNKQRHAHILPSQILLREINGLSQVTNIGGNVMRANTHRKHTHGQYSTTQYKKRKQV